MLDQIATTAYEYSLREHTSVEVGDSKQADFYPQVKFKAWNNQSNVSVRFDKELAGSSVVLEGERFVWTSADGIEARIYEKDNLPISGEPGLEFEIVLASKPVTNIFRFTTSLKSVNGDVQKALTSKEIEQGAFRPDYCVNSLAFYHSSMKGGIYKAGKALHIYRPRAVDAVGTEAWCTLDFSDGILSVTVPQDFLNSAVYPVIVDPTFGYTTVGGSFLSVVQNQATAGVYQANASVNIDKLTFYVKQTGGNANCKGVMWGGGTTPAAIITNGVTPVFQATSGTGSWVDATYISKPSVTNGTNYRLGFVGELNFPWTSIAYDGTAEIDATNSYATPNTYEPTSTEPTYQPSVYATYTASRVKDFFPFFRPFK